MSQFIRPFNMYSYNDKMELIPDCDGDQTYSGIIAPLAVDSNSTGFGAALYVASDGHLDEADASAVGTMPCRALACESGTGVKNVLLIGFMRNDTWNWTPGGAIYVSETTGALTQTAPVTSGAQVQIVGFAFSADIIFFNSNYATGEMA